MAALYFSALWLYEFEFQIVSRYSTLVQFQSGTRKFVLFAQTLRRVCMFSQKVVPV